MTGTPPASETAVPTEAPPRKSLLPVDAVNRAIDICMEDNYYNNLSLTGLMTAINSQVISELIAHPSTEASLQPQPHHFLLQCQLLLPCCKLASVLIGTFASGRDVAGRLQCICTQRDEMDARWRHTGLPTVQRGDKAQFPSWNCIETCVLRMMVHAKAKIFLIYYDHTRLPLRMHMLRVYAHRAIILRHLPRATSRAPLVVDALARRNSVRSQGTAIKLKRSEKGKGTKLFKFSHFVSMREEGVEKECLGSRRKKLTESFCSKLIFH
eukprot:IDg1941t1